MKKLLLAFAATGLVQITGFAGGILLARLLAPDLRGEFAQIIAWYSFFPSILLLGINDSVTYYRSRGEDEGGAVMGAALLLCLPLGLLSLALCCAVLTFVFADMSLPSLQAAWLFLLFPLLYQLQQVVSSWFQSGSNVTGWTAIRVIPGVSYVAGLVLAMRMGFSSPVFLIAANLAGLVLMLAVGGYLFRRSGDRLVWPSFATIRRVYRFGLPTVGQRIASACRDVLDRMALPFFVSSTALGHYVVASSTAYLVYVAGITVDLIGFPAMARATSEDARRRMAEFLISITFCALVVLVTVLTIVCRPVVLILFGEDYLSAASLVPWFLLAGAAQALRIVIAGAFKAFNLSSRMARIELVGAAIMIGILLIASARLGIYAGVLAHLCSALVSLAMALHAAIVVLKLSPRHVFLPRRSDLAKVVADSRAAFRSRLTR